MFLINLELTLLKVDDLEFTVFELIITRIQCNLF